MGLKNPRPKFERMDAVLSAKAWPAGVPVARVAAATCRNLSARGCRLQVEDADLLRGLDVESPVHFSFRLEPGSPEIQGSGKVAWLTRQRGEGAKIQLILGIEFTGLSFSDRERIKSYIASQLQLQAKRPFREGAF